MKRTAKLTVDCKTLKQVEMIDIITKKFKQPIYGNIYEVESSVLTADQLLVYIKKNNGTDITEDELAEIFWELMNSDLFGNLSDIE
jgi:hypothetical protein